jgi:bifunctional DNase/RNase
VTAVREMRVAAVAVAVRSRQPLLLLQECAGHERVLAIEIRISEATMLEDELAGRQSSRPAPHHLAGDVISACGRHVVGVCINMPEHDVFDAEIVFDAGEPFAARPGDAVALALYSRVPILASVDALNQAGLNPRHVIDVDAGDDLAGDLERFRQFLSTTLPSDFEAG